MQQCHAGGAPDPSAWIHKLKRVNPIRKETMGHRVRAKCLDCGASFTVNHGGGFAFHLLRCDKCGKTKSVSFDLIWDIHDRYWMGVKSRRSGTLPGQDKPVSEQVDGALVSEEEYHQAVEKIAGMCKCGGRHGFDAPPRCPKCRSAHIKEGAITAMYD
ncbi:MAG: hypothetical protein RBS99_19800 [Rhodospirillales bacterium]|jgi:hypothetical protein|nr:hypothetical protein [Rhodospirillales bacterium]